MAWPMNGWLESTFSKRDRRRAGAAGGEGGGGEVGDGGALGGGGYQGGDGGALGETLECTKVSISATEFSA